MHGIEFPLYVSWRARAHTGVCGARGLVGLFFQKLLFVHYSGVFRAIPPHFSTVIYTFHRMHLKPGTAVVFVCLNRLKQSTHCKILHERVPKVVSEQVGARPSTLRVYI